MARPSEQVNVIRPVAFLEKLALLLATNMEMDALLSLILEITKAPVLNSAAIPCTAQNIDLNGFWLIHRCFTEVTQLSSEIDFTRTPVKKAAGSLKAEYLFIWEGVTGIVLICPKDS